MMRGNHLLKILACAVIAVQVCRMIPGREAHVHLKYTEGIRMLISRNQRRAVFFLAMLVSFSTAFAGDAPSGWQILASGMDLKYVTAQKPSIVGDSRIG